MRVVSFITEGRVIRRILDHLGGAKRPQRALRNPSTGGGGTAAVPAPQAVRARPDHQPHCRRKSKFLSLD